MLRPENRAARLAQRTRACPLRTICRTTSLTRTLSVLLPVHNAQATLQTDVGEMLDLLPDLAHDFDLLIIDDGSTDATCEVAEELAKQFPQVKFVRHSRRRGIKAALNDGLARTQSRIVL